jgi:hypothetical protein
VGDLPSIAPSNAIDVGVGYGKVGDILKTHFPKCITTGYEVFPDYISDNVRKFYSKIIIGDFLKEYNKLPDFWCDLIVFGDVLEHFKHSEALDVLHVANYRCRWIALFTPLSYLQGAIEGNIFERHQSIIGLSDLVNFNIIHYVKHFKENIIYCLIKGLTV